MALDTYAGLKATILDFSMRKNDPDLIAATPGMIGLAEAQINRRLRVRSMIGRSTALGVLEAFQLPSDFLAERSLTITGTDNKRHDLMFVTAEGMDQMWDRSPSTPRYWTIVGDQVRLHPVEDRPYTLTLTYYKRIPSLSDANPSNWLLASHPDAYLYGALLQTAPYLIDDQRVGMWTELFTAILKDIQDAGEDATGATLGVDIGLRHRGRYNIYNC